MAKIDGKDLVHYISVNDGADFDLITCLTQNGISLSRSSTTTDTKCGSIVSTGSVAGQFTGTGLIDDAPASGQMSYLELLQLFLDDTEFIIVEHNTGESVYVVGTGKISAISTDNGSSANANFSYTVDISGAVTIGAS